MSSDVYFFQIYLKFKILNKILKLSLIFKQSLLLQKFTTFATKIQNLITTIKK